MHRRERAKHVLYSKVKRLSNRINYSHVKILLVKENNFVQ